MNDYERGDVCVTRLRKARKAHLCYECGQAIVPGTVYAYTSGVWEGSGFDYKMCCRCRDVFDWLCPRTEGGGILFGDLDATLDECQKEEKVLTKYGEELSVELLGWAWGLLYKLRVRWKDQEEEFKKQRQREIAERKLHATG